MNNISIIICTYNPDNTNFQKCLIALDISLKIHGVKEIIIIDNNSTIPITTHNCVQSFLQSNSNARVINESQQGLTPSRLRGIQESTGELLIFIDDDNIIRPDFIQQANYINENYTYIGAFSGQVQLQYDAEPPHWTKKYWGMLVHRLFRGNHWGNSPFINEIMPNGAGLCVKRSVAEHYKYLHDQGLRKITLDRSSGLTLLSGGDNDLAMCACDIGLGMGLFDMLYLDHIIPPDRFTLQYLSRLAYGIYYSHGLLKYMRTGHLETPTIKRRLYDQARNIFSLKEHRKIAQSIHNGALDAVKTIKSQNI